MKLIPFTNSKGDEYGICLDGEAIIVVHDGVQMDLEQYFQYADAYYEKIYFEQCMEKICGIVRDGIACPEKQGRLKITMVDVIHILECVGNVVPNTYEFRGYEVLNKVARKQGGASGVNLPKDWLGKNVVVIRVGV